MNKSKLGELEEQAYLYAYNQILSHPLYNSRIFSTFEEFKKFCAKDFRNKSGLEKLFLQQQIQLANVIVEKISEYYLTHNNHIGSKSNEPITYFKCVYRR